MNLRANMQWVNGLHFNDLRGDIYGGLTAAVVALPLSMSMGVASGVGPIAGIYGAIFVGLFAAIAGGTPSQVSGPTGPMTVVMAAIFTQYTGMYPDNLAHGATLAFTVVIMGGLFQIGLGLLKVGKYIELVPTSVVSGFMSGIGIIIILLQMGPLVGAPTISSPMDAALHLWDYVTHIEYHALELGVLVLVMVYGIPNYLPALNRMIPAPLFALIAATLFYIFFMEEGSTPTVADIPSGLPSLTIPVIEFDILIQMIGSALTLAGLGAIDSLLTSLVADSMTRTQHKSDRELIGQGIGNTVAGFFGGLPGAGATMRTVVNIKAGGRTPISGALHSIVLVAIILGAGSLASEIPKAVLAGILIKVGTDVIDWDYISRVKDIPRASIIIMVTVMTVTVVVDLLIAVGIGMTMASFIFMHRMTRMQVDGIHAGTNASEISYLSDAEAEIIDRADGQIMIFHLSGPMSFSSAKAMVRRHASIANYKIMILDLTDVPMIADYTTARALEDIIIDTRKAGYRIFVAGANGPVLKLLSKLRITDNVKPEKIQTSRLKALQLAERLLDEINAEDAGKHPAAPG
jgi:SulP family sulfate permease